MFGFALRAGMTKAPRSCVILKCQNVPFADVFVLDVAWQMVAWQWLGEGGPLLLPLFDLLEHQGDHFWWDIRSSLLSLVTSFASPIQDVL